jgi:quinol monooxygenase YgiN
MQDSDQPSRRVFLNRVGAAAAAALGGAAGPARAEDDAVITAVTFIHGIPGQEQQLKAHLLSLAAPTRAEAGCITYDLYQSPEQNNEFMRFEKWKSLQDLELHKATPHLKASFERRQREGWTTQITVWRRVPE